jgi:selenide,water dikinase
VPVFNGVLAMALTNRSGGMQSNQEHFGAGVRFVEGVDPARQALLFDPQTSGGLLIAVAGTAAASIEAALTAAGVLAARVGLVEPAVPSVQIAVRA